MTVVTDSPMDQVAQDYSIGPDPWGYAYRAAEAERYAAALGMLDESAAGARLRVVDVGCGEGFFTERLAHRYGSVLGLDAMRLALDRAIERCAELTNVELREWDVRSDSCRDSSTWSLRWISSNTSQDRSKSEPPWPSWRG